MTTIKVIGVGYARTGTLSLKTALDQLGFRCYHMFELFNRPADAPLWLRAYNGENRQHLFKKIFADYEATVDFPSISFCRDLLDQYPDAKVILTVRDSDSWCESFQNTINKFHQSVSYLIGLYVKNPALFKIVNKSLISPLARHFSNKQHIIQVYEEHNAEMLKYVSPERLLIYRVEQGWKPLCDFLNVPTPGNTPFPRMNDRETMVEVLQQIERVGWACLVAGALTVVLILGLFYYWFWV